MQRDVIMRFFDGYRKEVENHFAYEEDIVFPYVRSVAGGQRIEGYSMETFEENHNNIDEKLNDLRNIVMKYLPPVCDTVTAIKSILIPMVNRLEGKCQ